MSENPQRRHDDAPNGRVFHLVQVGLLLAGGIALTFLGQIELGAGLIGAAIGNATPQNLAAAASKLPPFYRKDPE